MSNPSDKQSDGDCHDAELVVKKTRIGALIAWRWDDGRMTVTPTEHSFMEGVVAEAEDRYDAAELESDDVVGRVCMDDEGNLQNTEWANV